MDGGRKEFTFFWFVENYSYCWHENGEELVSPRFTADGLEGTAWTIGLCPRGWSFSYRDHVSLFLTRSEEDDGPDSALLIFELSFLAVDGSPLSSGEFGYSFKRGEQCGKLQFLHMHEMLFRRKADYLPQDILTVCCKIWKGEGNVHSVAPICARTRIGVENISYLHVVENFSRLESRQKNTVEIRSRSRKESFSSSSLYVTRDSCSEGEMVVEITPFDSSHVLCKRKISLLGSGNVIVCSDDDNRFDVEGKDIGELPLSLTMQEILNKKSEFLPDDKLTFLCECSFSTGLEFEKIEGAQYEMPVAAARLTNVQKLNENDDNLAERASAYPSGVSEDMKALYVNKSLTDMELKIEGAQYEMPVAAARLTNVQKLNENDDSLAERASVYPSGVSEDMKALYVNKSLTDMELKIEGAQYEMPVAAARLTNVQKLNENDDNLAERASVYPSGVSEDMKALYVNKSLTDMELKIEGAQYEMPVAAARLTNVQKLNENDDNLAERASAYPSGVSEDMKALYVNKSLTDMELKIEGAQYEMPVAAARLTNVQKLNENDDNLAERASAYPSGVSEDMKALYVNKSLTDMELKIEGAQYEMPVAAARLTNVQKLNENDDSLAERASVYPSGVSEDMKALYVNKSLTDMELKIEGAQYEMPVAAARLTNVQKLNENDDSLAERASVYPSGVSEDMKALYVNKSLTDMELKIEGAQYEMPVAAARLTNVQKLNENDDNLAERASAYPSGVSEDMKALYVNKSLTDMELKIEGAQYEMPVAAARLTNVQKLNKNDDSLAERASAYPSGVSEDMKALYVNKSLTDKELKIEGAQYEMPVAAARLTNVQKLNENDDSLAERASVYPSGVSEDMKALYVNKSLTDMELKIEGAQYEMPVAAARLTNVQKLNENDDSLAERASVYPSGVSEDMKALYVNKSLTDMELKIEGAQYEMPVAAARLTNVQKLNENDDSLAERASVYPSGVSEDMKALYVNKSLTDMELKIEGAQYEMPVAAARLTNVQKLNENDDNLAERASAYPSGVSEDMKALYVNKSLTDMELKIEGAQYEMPVAAARLTNVQKLNKNDDSLAERASAYPSGVSEDMKALYVNKSLTDKELKIEGAQYEMPVAAAKLTNVQKLSKNDDSLAERAGAYPSGVTEDMKTLYINKYLTDVELKTKTKSFPAHKVMLCLRSPVLKRMLVNETKEKNADSIRVDDLQDDVLQLLLIFLYSDTVEKLEWEVATRLYHAACKYQIQMLEEVCSSFLVANLTPTNAGELLLLADTHSNPDLKKSAEDFILEHEREVFASEEWEALMETNPLLVMKAMHLKYKR